MKTKFFQKTINLFLVVLLSAGLILTTSPVAPAQAADFSVGTYAELENAITTANSNGVADTITLTNNITLTGTLPQITSEITIEGAGYTLSGDNSFQVFNVFSLPPIVDGLVVASRHFARMLQTVGKFPQADAAVDGDVGVVPGHTSDEDIDRPGIGLVEQPEFDPGGDLLPVIGCGDISGWCAKGTVKRDQQRREEDQDDKETAVFHRRDTSVGNIFVTKIPSVEIKTFTSVR